MITESVEEIELDLKQGSKKVRKEQMKLRKNVKKNLGMEAKVEEWKFLFF